MSSTHRVSAVGATPRAVIALSALSAGAGQGLMVACFPPDVCAEGSASTRTQRYRAPQGSPAQTRIPLDGARQP
jgi:hypothetical protein